MFTLLYSKWITNKDLLHNTVDRAQGILQNVMLQPGWDRSLGENGYMYIYG